MKRPYRIEISREGATIKLRETFFDDAVVVPADGTTQLDDNLAALLTDIKIAVYWIATEGHRH